MYTIIGPLQEYQTPIQRFIKSRRVLQTADRRWCLETN